MATTPQELFEINQTDIKSLYRQMSDLGSELARMKKIFRLDEKEDQNRRDDKYQEVLHYMKQTSENLSEMSRIIKVMGYTSVLEDENYFNHKRVDEMEKQGSRLENEIRDLSNLTKKTMVYCPEDSSHNHKGIQFLSDDGNVFVEMCPVTWWGRMAFLRFREGTLKKFREEFPFDKYMEKFAL